VRAVVNDEGSLWMALWVIKLQEYGN
jgi:hypothetical protein